VWTQEGGRSAGKHHANETLDPRQKEGFEHKHFGTHSKRKKSHDLKGGSPEIGHLFNCRPEGVNVIVYLLTLYRGRESMSFGSTL